MKKVIALLTVLAFTAPLAAQAATPANTNTNLIQKIESTYHTSFPTTAQ
jgi:hypothetical protein